MQTTQTPTVADYMNRLRQLADDGIAAGTLDWSGRFFLVDDDDTLLEWERLIRWRDQDDTQVEFHDQLLAQFDDWRLDMTPSEWADIITYNAELPTPVRNSIISELAGDE